MGGAPFCNAALTPYPTTRHAVAFPTAKPDRPAWLKEMDPLPVIGLGDDADIVAACKLGLIVLMSNESARRRQREPDQEFGDLLRDSASAELDRGSCTAPTTPSLAGWWRPRRPPQARTWPPR